jgi:hypothetical protein
VKLLLEDLHLGALGGAAEQLATATVGIFSLRGKRFIPANFREYTIYPPLVLHQSLICFVLIHGIFTNLESHSSLDFKHKIFGTLAVP